MIDIENLEVKVRDTTRIGISALDRAGVLVELSGEFDDRDLSTLRKALSVVSSCGLSTIVDLSDVTFLDVRCARELAVRSCFDDLLILCDPSWQAEASFKVCGHEARVVHHLRRGSSREESSQRTKARQERADAEPRGIPALAV